MTTFESGSEDLAHDRIAAIESMHERPNSEGKIQALLIEEYYASLPESWDKDVVELDKNFFKDKSLGKSATDHWRDDGLALAFRKLMDEMKQNDDKEFSKVTLDMVKQYLD